MQGKVFSILMLVAAALLVLGLPEQALACHWCRSGAAQGIYDRDFLVNLLMLTTPLALIAGIAAGIYYDGRTSGRL